MGNPASTGITSGPSLGVGEVLSMLSFIYLFLRNIVVTHSKVSSATLALGFKMSFQNMV
jgi:hypothetical protein